MKLKIGNRQKIIIVISSFLFSIMFFYTHLGLKVLISDEQYLLLGLKNLWDAKSIGISGGLMISNSQNSDEFINTLSQVNLDIEMKLNQKTWDMNGNIGVRLFDSSETVFHAGLLSHGDKFYVDLQEYIDKAFEFPGDLKQAKIWLNDFWKARSSFDYDIKSSGYEDVYFNFIHHRYYVTYVEFSYEMRGEKLFYGRASEYQYPLMVKFYQDMSGNIKRILFSADIKRMDRSNVDHYEIGLDIQYLDSEFKSSQIEADVMMLDEKGIEYILKMFRDKVMGE